MLYLGIDCSTQSLTAVVIEIAGDTRRVVFNRSLNYDRDLPAYGTTGGVIYGADGEVQAPPAMWVDALDRMLAGSPIRPSSTSTACAPFPARRNSTAAST